MKTKYSYLFLFFLWNSTAFAQINLKWSTKYNPFGNLASSSYIIDDQLRINSLGNIICGWQNHISQFNSNYSLGVTNYDVNGNLAWELEYTGSFSSGNYLKSCILDNSDNVYIMGEVNSSTFVEDDVCGLA